MIVKTLYEYDLLDSELSGVRFFLLFFKVDEKISVYNKVSVGTFRSQENNSSSRGCFGFEK